MAGAVVNMADKKKSKKKSEEFEEQPEDVKRSKEEYEVAKWMRANVPTKKTKFLNHNVQYFTGKKAVDALMASTWGTSIKEGDEPFFSSRAHCIDFLDGMLHNKFFHRAKKVPINEELLKGKKKGKDEKEKKSIKDDKEKKDDKTKKDEKKKKDDGESSHAEGKGQELSENEDDKQKKKKKKVRLEMHFDQFFADNLDAYVWIYEPIPPHYWLFGALVVMAGIGVCLFPLWPPSVRLVVYYLSIAAAGFLVFVVFLTVVRTIVFCLLWLVTLGKHHLWLFPNLTEDVGFFASFWPLYKYEYKPTVEPSKKKKKKKEKLSDNEDEPEPKEKENVEEEAPKSEPTEISEVGEGRNEADGSGSESESSSQQSQTGKDFEIVDKAEIEAQQ